MPSHATLVTNVGSIKVRLLSDVAPKTVENFLGLSTGAKEWKDPRSGQTRNEPLYPGTIFHRVIPEFMIQGGDPTGTGRGDPGYRFEDEVAGSPPFDKPGYLAMANSGPNTNGCQFFITVAATPWLNGKHTVFGEVVDGQPVADEISKVATGAGDKPLEDVVIERIDFSD